MKRRVFYKKTIIFLCALAVSAGFLFGCGKKEQEGQAKLYFLNQNGTYLSAQDYEITGSDTEKQIGNMISSIRKEGQYTDNTTPLLPEGVRIERYIFQDHQLYLYFNDAYQDMDTARELLCRSGIVLSLVQINGVSGVSFFADQKPLTDGNGEKIGIMTADSFAADLDPSAEIRSSAVNATVYYASHDGTRLVGEDCTLTTEGSKSLCRKILERLMEEPEKKGSLSTIPRNTRINSVTVLDDTCLVDFSAEFRNQNTKVRENVLVYSIVDSLTSIPGIKNVQISVDGKTEGVVRYNMRYNRYYSMNSDLIRTDS